ncbi:hypothetical protein FRC06_010446, partial [Ceratobasidium sp. 370]
MTEPSRNDTLLLSINEIIEAAKPYIFPRAEQRSCKVLLEALDDVPEDVSARIAWVAFDAREEKTKKEQARRAAKREQDTRYNAKRRKLSVSDMDAIGAGAATDLQEDEDETFYHCQPAERDLNRYLELPSAEELKDLHR